MARGVFGSEGHAAAVYIIYLAVRAPEPQHRNDRRPRPMQQQNSGVDVAQQRGRLPDKHAMARLRARGTANDLRGKIEFIAFSIL